MKPPLKLLNLIRNGTSFLIVCHINPEADAIGSCIALALGLKRLGKKAFILSRDPLPDSLVFLPASHLVRTKPPARPSDTLLIVDCNSPERTGFSTLSARAAAIIDHHVPTPGVTRRSFNSELLVNFIEPEASAAGELVYSILHALRVPIDRRIATNLFTSIYSDTGGFRYANTSPESLRISSRLIEAGADPWRITREVYENVPFRSMKLLALALSTLEKKGPVAWFTIDQRMLKMTGSSAQDTEDFANFPRSIKGIEVAVFFRQEAKDLYKISLRSKGKVDVQKIASKLGGGGHSGAAGCRLRGGLKTVQDRTLREIRKALKT